VAVTNPTTPLKFERIKPAARQKIAQEAAAVRTFRQERHRWEATAAAPRTAAPARERQAAETPAPARRESAAPARERQAAETPAAPREAAFVPPREVRVPQPERVRIPTPPSAGKSSVLEVFRKGPPTRPADESRDKEGKDIRKSKATGKDRRGH
jgi:sRNA-binding protein